MSAGPVLVVEGASRRARQQHADAVLIVDDHTLLAEGLRFALRDEGIETIIQADVDIACAVDIAQRRRPLLALLDLQFEPSGASGLDLIAPLTATGTPVLVLTGVTEKAILGRCLELGAVGVASKAEPFDRVLDRIESAIAGEPVNGITEREDLLAAALADRTAERHRWESFRDLSARESAVLHLLAKGVAADAIAAQTYVSIATVRTQIQAIFRKLGVNSQIAAVAKVHECGWSPDALRGAPVR